MKFLCLPGAYGSAKNFAIQLGPLAEEMSRRSLGTFSYTQGSHAVEPPPGWEGYFGAPPLFRFLDTTRGDAFETLRRLRHVPQSMNPEDTIREFQRAGPGSNEWHARAWQGALDDVFRTIDGDDEVDALLGYSEGAMVGASVIVEEAKREAATGRRRRIKFAVFISGAPPLRLDGHKIVSCLRDEAGVVIDIPTFHIFGCDDAFLSSAVALYNVCDPDGAKMYDHGLGHIVPRDAENVGLLGEILGRVVPRVEADAKRQRQREMAEKRAAARSTRAGAARRPGGRERSLSELSVGSTGGADGDFGVRHDLEPLKEMDFTSG
ncbi:serine hydrolase-domain-containing protein [Podospora conica]|nr:serine hydrolase-domain-containing protein [Schizothecium conicum]